jgi:hypothetical protein
MTIMSSAPLTLDTALSLFFKGVGLQPVAGINGRLVEAKEANDVQVPFLQDDLASQLTWEFRVEDMSLSPPPGVLVESKSVECTLTAWLDAYTGRPIFVILRVKNGKGPLRAPAEARSAARKLLEIQEVYHAFPTNAPNISFLNALDHVLRRGIGNPFDAQEVVGLYVMESRNGSDPLPVWAITLRGIPPRQPHGRDHGVVPEWQLNHIRDVIDANTGDILFATNVPQPD